jgi:hypothetical protein
MRLTLFADRRKTLQKIASNVTNVAQRKPRNVNDGKSYRRNVRHGHASKRGSNATKKQSKND